MDGKKSRGPRLVLVSSAGDLSCLPCMYVLCFLTCLCLRLPVCLQLWKTIIMVSLF